MDWLFERVSKILVIFSILFIITPFIFIIFEGFNFIISLPFPQEIVFSIKLSLKTSILATFLVSVTSVIISQKIHFNPKHKEILKYIYSFPLSMPHLVSGLALITLYGHNNLGKYLEIFNIDFVYTPSGIVLALFFINLPYAIIFLNSAMDSVDDSIFFTANNLGLNNFKVFIHVLIPLIRQHIITMVLLIFSRCLGEFGAVMMLVGVTRMKTETLATSIFLNMTTGDFDVACGVAIILMLINLFINLMIKIIIKEKSVGDKNIYYK
ncbi:Sulfate transport system permease protein CysW [Peptoniphilus indolicus]|uniref:Molybdenum (Mo2+) ABC superfamily ATP binding cassette transporter, membrane protein n=2 Tax=Peptoniphilus indolicus TaxID=33030 RepID=G4D1Q7_9FIRM|nr:molybdenum (Mo2+) ABC superfamily ATP binding cassette transporter, membrane protein [Peptoniphilus indolicus ATCC 29427]SUB75579.1 Sulfate transport system permease protein CysW [Peptoniphilus indolicus]